MSVPPASTGWSLAATTPVSAVAAGEILTAASCLLAALLLLLASLTAVTALRHWHRRRWAAFDRAPRKRPSQQSPAERPGRTPSRWLAVRNRDQQAVQAALGLSNPRVDTYRGQALDPTAHQLAILPPVQGWTLVVGPELPDPSRDVDRCFRLLQHLSLELGELQYFSVDWGRNHHAWAWLDHGRVIRAFAWAGATIWQQGNRTAAEDDLDMTCPDYGESSSEELISGLRLVNLNPDKLLALAARWSLDPTRLTAASLAGDSAVIGECRLGT